LGGGPLGGGVLGGGTLGGGTLGGGTLGGGTLGGGTLGGGTLGGGALAPCFAPPRCLCVMPLLAAPPRCIRYVLDAPPCSRRRRRVDSVFRFLLRVKKDMKSAFTYSSE